MGGIWVRSQDGKTLVFVKTFEAWKNGRIVARYGENHRHLGSYGSEEEAGKVISDICEFIDTSKGRVYQMPLN